MLSILGVRMHDTAAAAGAHGWLGALSRVALSCGARTPCECLMQGIKDSPPPLPIHPHPSPSHPIPPPISPVQDRPGSSRYVQVRGSGRDGPGRPSPSRHPPSRIVQARGPSWPIGARGRPLHLKGRLAEVRVRRLRARSLEQRRRCLTHPRIPTLFCPFSPFCPSFPAPANNPSLEVRSSCV